ncbi:MAG: phosphohydrolase [Candidatus Cloacimonetes bacterium]|jgi:metal-dependent HD superfamily phosphatase/phosphodiesterase|nr:phosphohydrolase [Candidatus Cloacimonadota bacterium]MDY0336696.1 phosphohydrolase [Candidatus Cloacimonadaceae bacterium]MCB5269481.1 phosphohydrolase [Candidatus Cloacimonadota bacterium]MCK9334198.1 phosphohydrolase [Candidatus Cloacimonadota bacterium]MDD2543854.1 phosphohydrolase [Candidatus Cloacimonadota bacterium]
MNKSVKQIQLEKRILKLLSGKPLQAMEMLFADPQIQAMQEYANVVSIKRLGYNDHGPVHMRKATLNTIMMFHLLTEAGIKMNLEKENVATADDSLIGVIMASLMHDMGMTIARDSHEYLSIQLATPFIDKVLAEIYSAEDYTLKAAVRSIAIEGIFGHMATHNIHSLEAGLVLIGDGSDMEKGRARIPSILSSKVRPGDIHRTSASAIQKVRISKGNEKPISIEVEMNASVGFFQIEEVFFPKINISPVKPYIELYAGVVDREMLRYL